jgi:OmpA-OmpF porin, OOP family
MAVPLVLAYLGRMHSSGSLTGSSFASVFKSGTADLGGYTLSPASADGVKETVDGVRDRFETTADTTGRTVRGVVSRPADKPTRWAVPLGIVAVALIGWAIARSVGHHRTASVAVNSTVCPATDVAGNAIGNTASSTAASLGNLVPVTLPNGRRLNVPECGVEKRLIDYLGNAGAPAGTTTFVFDRVSFDPDSATLRPGSNEQLNNVAAIMQAYPTAKIRLGGYSNVGGDASANQRLSEQRADGVMTELTNRGVEPSRLNSQDVGVASNSTTQGLANGQVSIRVAEK